MKKLLLIFFTNIICLNLSNYADDLIGPEGDPYREYFYFRTKPQEKPFKKVDNEFNAILDRIEKIDSKISNKKEAQKLREKECNNIKRIYKTISQFPKSRSKNDRMWKIEDLVPYTCGSLIELDRP